MAISKIEQAQLDVLDILIMGGGSWECDDGLCLLGLAREVYGEHVEMGSKEYKYASLAVLGLEAVELIEVKRRYANEAYQSNVIERISVT